MDFVDRVIPAETVAAVSAYYPDVAHAWLDSLPVLIDTYARRWEVALLPAFTRGVASWKAPGTLPDGTVVVLKLSVPDSRHGARAADALRLWDGRGAVRLLAFDDADRAMLLERCEPGSALDSVSSRDATRAVVDVFRQLWIRPPDRAVFPLLRVRMEGASELTVDRLTSSDLPLDPGLMHEIASLPDELAVPTPTDVLLLGDPGMGNVLLSARGWLAIDPSPVIGDPAYDAARSIVQRCDYSDLRDQIGELAGALSLDTHRIAAWVLTETAGALGWFAHTGDREGLTMRLEHFREAVEVYRG